MTTSFVKTNVYRVVSVVSCAVLLFVAWFVYQGQKPANERNVQEANALFWDSYDSYMKYTYDSPFYDYQNRPSSSSKKPNDATLYMLASLVPDNVLFMPTNNTNPNFSYKEFLDINWDSLVDFIYVAGEKVNIDKMNWDYSYSIYLNKWNASFDLTYKCYVENIYTSNTSIPYDQRFTRTYYW